ncbi:hyperosmolarity resistance protein Ebh [Staphylococcus pasteuri]|uniref:hyperosmolarity resistance protein Ebh n=1 Tax=Staphylococcus pasteuri TaxID=45972 RepID=UPI003C7A9DDE
MNDREKLQKFSIRKYTVGTFSTVIATLVFLGFNASNAQAEEASAKEQTKTQIYQHQDGQQSNSSDLAKQEANKISQTTDKANTNVETSTDNSSQESTKVANLKKSNQSEQNSSNSSKAPLQNSENTVNKNHEVTNSSDLEQGNTLQNEQLNHAENKLTAHVEDSSRQIDLNNNNDNSQSSQIDKNVLQAFFDANYHDYRFVDREKADKTTFNQVKAAFDKINLLLGSNDELDNKTLQLAYKELEQAVATIKTLPKRQAQVRRNHRIEERAVETKSGSDYQNANSAYYVTNNNDGSGYSVGTYISASNRVPPIHLPNPRWNTLRAADTKEIALVYTKQVKDGYEWTIKFNKSHWNHEHMVFWFGLPEGQTPVGRTIFSILNKEGTHSFSSFEDKSLSEFWKNTRSLDNGAADSFVQGPIQNHTFYDDPTFQIRSFTDFSRAGDYFNQNGASETAKNFGLENFKLLNKEKPSEIPGLDKIYAFIGHGENSYTIQFKTTGPTADRLYYAAGGRAYEYNQLFMYNQLYVEPRSELTKRTESLYQTINRTYHLGNTVTAYDPDRKMEVTRYVLDGTKNSNDFVTDPLSYVASPNNRVLGFFPAGVDYSHKRTPGSISPLNSFQVHQMFNDSTLEEAARTGRPIKFMIGFDIQDGAGNEETIVPAQLTVKPAVRNIINFFTNDETLDRGEQPISKAANHPVFSVNPGEMQNSTSQVGNKTVHNQPLRINLVSNEPFTDNDWTISGFPSTLRIENSVDRVNTNYEKNIELVGTLAPGDYFGTVRFGKKEQTFEIRVKPEPPHIDTTAEELRGKGGTKQDIVVSNVPLDPKAIVYLINTGPLGRNGTNDPNTVPINYNILATGNADGEHSTITISKDSYNILPLPKSGNIKAIVFYNKNVQSNWGNEVEILPDVTPPTISDPINKKDKYYRGDHVSFTVNVSDEQYGSGLKNTNIANLPSGWTSNFVKNSDGRTGVLSISGTIPNNQAFNSHITFTITANDNANNISQGKQISIDVGEMSQDFQPIGLDNAEKIKVSDPRSVTDLENILKILQALRSKNATIIDKLAQRNQIVVNSNGSARFTYFDGSTDNMAASDIITYNPIRNTAFASGDNLKQATIVIAKGQSYNIGDLKQYFALEDGSALPNDSFYNISGDNTLPTASQISRLDAGTYDYQVLAANAYHQTQAPLTLTLKVIDIQQPTDDQRVYRVSNYQLTDEEVTRVKQAFINSNSQVLPLTENDITVNNPDARQGVSTVTVTVSKDRLVKTFTSNLNNMSFLRWVDFPNDYQVSWTNPKIANRPTDGGLEWTPDHKSLIYRYDATLGQDFNTNEVLNLLVANTNIPGLRTNIVGTEKEAAEAGRRASNTTGYSLSTPKTDGQSLYTLDGQVIQVLDIVTTNTGIGGQTITYSNLSNNSQNSTLVNVDKPAINGAGAFTIDKVIKNNTISNAHHSIYRAQLYLSPTGPKPYIEYLRSNMDRTTDTINVYFVPSDKVNPTISVENSNNQQVYSGETYTNHITANDNYALQDVTVAPTSQLTGNVSNNNQQASFTIPNVTSSTSKTINLIATDTSGNSTEHSFNIAIKPLKDKYRVSTTSTAQNPVRIANISNNASISQEDQEAITNSVTLTEIVPNRSYATASTNEVQSKTVSNVRRRGNNADVTVTVTYTDGTSSTVTVPVKHILYNVIASPKFTIQGQNFVSGKGSAPSDFFTLDNGDPVPDATITWLPNNTPNKNNSTIGENITVRANILFDGETSPIEKESSYMVVKTVPKQVFVAPKLGSFPDITDVNNPKEFLKPINNSWSNQPENMRFEFIGNNGLGPNTRQIGFQTRLVRVTYANGQTENVRFLSKVRPDPPIIDANSVSYKAGLTNQEVKLSNVLPNSTVQLFKADGTPLTITNPQFGDNRTLVVTVSDALPDGEIKATATLSEGNLSYTSINDRGQVTNERHSETVDSLDSDSVRVTPQLQAIDEGAVLVKGGNNFDFDHAERFIKNVPSGATATWQDNPDNWKNTVGSFTKTVTVTLPNDQGTRTVDIPVKIYPSAVAISPARDKKGTNLTHGTQAINYIIFEPNQNTTGITAEWANNSAPTSNTAGVQNLTINVNYPGIPTPVQVPVKVYVYQFDFPQSEYTTTLGTTFASGIDASQYAHNENGDGLPTDGFTYRWNKTATGTNNASWSAMNKPNAAKVVNATYDVLYNGRTFATSQPAKFIVKNVQPTKPTISETAQGEITIAPGNDQRINTSSGNVTTYADRLIIKRNGNVITSFNRNNNRSPWTKEQSAHTVAGLVGTGNGITVAAGTFNPADTIQVIATQGSGELTSAEQPSDEFTVIAPQPNQVLSTAWDNGQLDITPNNPTGNLVNPTYAVDISYNEKLANGTEQNKTLHVIKGANGKWSIADQPSYITLDSTTGKVTFNANTIKPNSEVTAVAKAGSGNAASSNSRTLTSPSEHTVTTDQIIKEFGVNVTADEINNAVHVNNKRNAAIKQGTNMPTSLAGGSTTTIPVIITYNDGSTEEVTETIFTKSDKRELITANAHLDDAISTDGKTPSSINQYNQAMTAAEQQINAAKAEANQVIQDQFASPQQVSATLTKVQAAQTKIDQAKALLQDKADNSELVTAKNNLQAAVDQVPSTDGMTQQSIDNYNTKQQVAQVTITNAQQVIDNGDATEQEIADEKASIELALTELNEAKANLTADTTALQQAVPQLNRTVSTTDKKPASITAYNQAMQALNSDLTSARNKANAIINKPIRTVQEVQDALTAVNRVNEQITQAIDQLQPLADNSELKAAKAKLDEEINKSVSTDGMTQESINAYQTAKQTAQAESNNAQQVIDNGDATDQDVAAEKAKVDAQYNNLKQAIANLTPDKAPLEAAKTDLENDINRSTSTTGMTADSVANFNEKRNAAQQALEAITQVLQGNPDVATIRDNITKANNVKSALDTARDNLTVDRAPLENAKNELQQSITQAENTSTTGMTQDSVSAFNTKLSAAKEKLQAITQVLNGSPTVADINTNTSQTNSIKSELDQARTNLTPDKAPLEAAKQALEQSINQPTDTVGMTTASLNEYNQKLEAARQTLNAVNQELAGQPSVQTINDKVTQATNAQSELDQARAGLTLDRQPTLEALQNATSLNHAQKDNFREQINAAQNHAGLETIQNSINALNTAMTALRDSIDDNDSIKTGINYTDATSSNRTNYDNAVNAAKDIIGEQNSPTMSPDAVNQKANTVNSTKDALDGEQNLQRAKQEAIDTITNANDLNQAQKNALTQQVTQAQNVLAANDIKQNTTALDTAMANLKQGVANHAQLVQDDNYVNADTNKKNDYDTAYNQANEIINGNAQNPTLIPNDVTNALQQVSQAETALNGSDNLNNAKQEAQTALGQLTHLNDAQRQQLQSQINDAHQVDTVNAAKELASNLDTAMNNLQNAIANNEAVKRGEDYLDADNEKQNNYNQAVSNAKQIISETTQPTMTVDAISQAINQVTSTKDALNGEEKLEQAKQQANNKLNTLSHLNNAQKANIASKINDATNIANVNSVKQNANDLNTAMGNLQDAISNENDTLNSQNYRDASSDKQTNYTSAVNEAKAILAQNGPNKTQDQVNAAIAKVNTAKNELNGNRNLEQAQQTAKQALSQLTHLTDAQKDHLTTQINNSTTVADVQGIQGNANTLDQAMNTLKQSIADQNTVRNSEDYNDASSDNQNSYNNAVTSAEDIINASTNPEMSADTINAKAQQVLHTKGDLNGDENLSAAKQNAQKYLDTLSHITNQQKDNLNTQITNALNISQVEQAKQSAQSLDTAMNNLQSAVNNENQIKTTENYTDADTNKQTAYDEAIAAAKAILNRDAGPNTPQNDVETALQRITNAQNELNGDHKINDAKTAAIQHLGTLNHLTTAQHNALENDINQATNLAGVEQVKQNADALNTSMGQLQTLVDDKNNVQNSQNYLDADSQNQSNYDMYLVTAESTINKATGPNISKSDVDTLVNQINQAQQALNGQQNLDQAKQSAINTIDQSTNLNTAQKDALKAQVTSGNLVADVNGVKQLATTLNTSMGNLRQSIANKAETLTNGNYINADNDKRNAYDTQVANAESIINGTNNVVLVPTDIDNATTSVTNAYNALNGDNNLRVAKENANNTIDGLAQLNNVQKANLREQVQNAQTLPDVQTVKTNAQTLNDAMRTLRDSVANEQTVKSSQNYTDANQDLQQAYDAQVNNANNIINETGTPTMDPNTITQAATQVTTAEGALNGAQNLVNAQNNAKANLNTLSHLTNAQKESITNQINSATHVNDVTTIQNDATQLNNAMGELAQAIQDQESTKQQVNYTNADQANQEAYNNAVAEAERILDKEHGANTSHADVQIAIQNVQSAKQALNGDRNVEIAKTNAKNALEHLTSLNNAQKAALTTQIENAPTVANVEQVSNTATQLNQAMAKLQQGINDNNDVLQSVDYTDADPTNQQTYTNSVDQANAILSKDNGTNADITQVQAALNQVTTAKNALNGEEKVAQAKEAAKQALATYNHLNTAQTNVATEQITNATTLAQVAQAQNTANELNTAMGELQNSINDQATVKNSVNFTDADQANQDAYTNAVTEAQSILDNAHGGNLNKEQVEAVTNKVSTAKDNLNGDAKVREAKADALNNLGTLNLLNDAQKAHLTNEINSASTVDGVNQVKTTAQNLNSAMQQLQQAIANKDETLNSQNYLDANTDKKNAYTGAVANAESILDKTSGTNADQNAVEQAIQNVTQTASELNGIQNLQIAKNDATQAIENLAHLNTPQKNALKEQVNQAQNVAAVTDLQNNANALDTAMDQLQQAVADHNTIVTDGNYTNASAEKQGKYTDAYQHAQNLINGSPDVVTNPADINTATQNVISAENELNGNTNLTNAKQEATEALSHLTDLTDAQRQSITNQINSATQLDEVANIKSNANALNNAMTDLRQEISHQQAVKTSQPFVDADNDRQTAYNDAINHAESIVSETTQPELNPSNVSQAMQQIKTAETGLNGAANLTRAKENALQDLNQLTHLNQAQRTDFTNQINDAQNIATVNQVTSIASSLNQAMGQLIDAVNDQTDVKQSVNYTDAEPSKQQDYNNAITSAESITNPTTGSNANQAQVETALSAINTAKQALNGTQKVNEAKNNASQELNGLDNLNNAQRENVAQKINQAQTVVEVEKIKQDAQDLNTAMTKLKESLADKDNTLDSQNYLDADNNKKTDYTNAVTNAENILNPTQGTNLTKEQVEAATNQVNSAKNDLNGTQNLNNAKQQATTNIDGLTNVTDAQKEALKQLVGNSSNVAEVQANLQKAQDVDQAMNHLKQSIADNTATKNDQNYLDASPNKQEAYNNAVDSAKDIIDNTSNPSLDPTVINQATTNVTNAKNELNGNDNLNQAKQEANQTVGGLNNLNNAQQHALNEQINHATSVDEVNQIKNNAQNLNNAMAGLKQAIADKDLTTSKVNFTDADPEKQAAYNQAITNAENILDKASGSNVSQTEVEQAIQQVNNAKQALNGDANVQQAKDEATELINNASDLNQAQKDVLIGQVNNATTVAETNGIKQTAQDLNNAMTQLKQSIADKDQTKADGNFTNADTDKQTAYNNAVTQAQQLIDGAPNVVVTPSEITDALNHVNQTKDELNGNTNLANAKQTVTNAIDQLPNLNQAQRDEYNKQITQATAVPDVNAIQTAAEKLNEAMTNLKQGIANKDDILAGEDYHDADQDKQAAFNDAISAAQDLLNQTASPTMDPTQVTNALTKVQETTQALNGNEKLETEKQNAKVTITTLDHLNSAQQHSLTDQIDQAPDIEHVNQIKQVAENLNNAMTALSNGLQDKTEILGNINYTDADQDKKDAYNAAIAHAENILDKANGGNVPQTEVEQALQQLTDAKQALNGNNNVQNAKNEAIQAIENASELNQAQKEALKQQVDLATTVDKVNGIKQTTQDLNQAMADLKQGIANHDQVITNGNYLNADQDKQSAYSDAVNHAQQIINGTPNAIVNPQEVTQALQQVTQTKGELNGDQNLQTAQQNATTMIDQLSNLNTPQKEALKQQVTQAGLVPDVDRVKQTANDLNTAMGNLKQQLQANSQVPQSIDYTQADNSKQVAYDNATNLAQQIVDGTPTAVLNVEDVNQALTNVNQAKDELNGNENLAQAKQEATTQLGTLQDLNQPQHDALAEQIDQAQSIDAVNQIKQTAQEVNNAMNQLKQSIANKDEVLGSENYHDADADKQTAYTNAVNQAEAIINQSSNPTLNASDIENTMNQVNNTHNELNGDAKLATEKQNGNTEINVMSHLNDAQKQALTTQIEQAPDIATVNQVKQTAQNLDQAMNQLAQSINDNAQTLTDGNYLNADQQNQEAYNQAVANAENVLNQHAGTNELQDAVERLTNAVNNAKQALNGNTNLAQAQQEATQFVNQLQHLNDAQKQNYNTQINQAPLVTDVSTIKQHAQALDQAMEQLRNSIADNQDTLASEDYHDATTERQNDYNNAVNAANNIINEATSPIMDPNDINSATSQVNATKVALDGDENLANTKQQATETIRQLSHLNQAQVQALEAQITQSSDIATVNQHLQTAQDLNSAMGNLIQAIANHNDIEQQGNFTNADNDKQTAYTDAIANAESIINPQTGQNASQTEVEQAITRVQDALQALNGDQNLQDAKVNAEQAINALVDLNDPQKQALIQQVNGAPLVTDVHQIEQNANTLNQAMHGLRESIKDNATVKTNSIYINEDPTEQQNYDQAVQHAQDIINEQTATLDENTINQATEAVNNAKQSLHGDVKLQNDKDHAKQIVSQLSHLNDAQKHMEDALIDSENTRTAVNNDLTEAQALDQLMDTLRQSIADKNDIHANSQYINAEPNKQQDYDTALQNAENIIAGTNNPTINKGDVSQATQAVDNTKQALDGVQRLEEDKQNAGTSLNQFDHLTPAQQQAIENAINNASTRDEVAQKLEEAQALNNAMQALKDSIQDHAQVEASSKFINEDPTQKGAYTDAVNHALDIINNDSNPILDKSAIEQATQAVNNAKDDLHGDQKLADDKQHANETLNQLNNLNTAQRDTLQNQINGASTRDEVAQIINHAQALDLAMENLKVSIKDQAQTEASSKFINEDPAQKDAYTQAVQHAQDLIDQTSNPTLDITQVDQLTQAVNNAKDNLHGDQKLEQAKQRALESLNNSTDLNQPQRQTLETQINQATTRDDINQILVNAADLNTAMGNLKASINDQAQVEASSKFINEDPAQKDAYTEAVTNAKDLINQTSNPTMDTNQIEQKIQEVINAKDNLHGDQKLEQDQQQATTTVDSLDHLNHAQQQAAKDAIAGATTRTEVAQLVQTATQLDQAMKSLKDQLNQINTDKAEPNYTEASTDKQDALNQAISNAENIVNPAQGTNANQTEVEQALTQLQETANDLNGNQRVADAKAQAKTDIDQ